MTIIHFSFVIASPSFEKPYYDGTYTITNNDHDISVEEINISADYEDLESLNLALQQEGCIQDI